MINVRCPTCDRVMQGQRLSEWPQFPFCSDRCKLVDLGRWLDEKYRLPSEEQRPSPDRAETDLP